MSEEPPDGWAVAPIGNLLREPLRNGHSAKASPDGKGVRTLTLSAVTYGNFSDANTKLTVADPDKVADLWLEPGDLLIERSNTPELVGTSRLYRGPKHWAIFPDLVIRARIGQAALPEYVEAHLQSVASRKYFTEAAQGTAGSMPKIDQGAVEAAEVALAPLPEQHRIVEKVEALLEQVNRAKARLDRVPLILKRFRQAVLAAACSGELTREWREQRSARVNTHPRKALLKDQRRQLWESRQQGLRTRKYADPFDAEQPFDLPDDWEWVSVSNLAFLDVGFAFKSTDFAKDGVRLLRGENVEPGALRWIDTKFLLKSKIDPDRHHNVEAGEIILALDRPIVAAGLKIARVRDSDLPALLVQRVMRFKMVDKADTDYLFYCLRDKRFIDFVAHEGMTGSDLPHITGTGVAEFPVPLPPREEQTELVRRIEALFALADTIERRVQAAAGRANKLPQAILSKAFSGELVPTEAELARLEGRTYETATELLKRVTASCSEASADGKGRGRRGRKAG